MPVYLYLFKLWVDKNKKKEIVLRRTLERSKLLNNFNNSFHSVIIKSKLPDITGK